MTTTASPELAGGTLIATGVCDGCLGSRQCWVCLGTGYELPENRVGQCSRCAGTARCHVCQSMSGAVDTPSVSPPGRRPGAVRRVLVVDDEGDVLDLVRIWLDDDPRCGAVDTATSCEQALLLLAENCPDAIVCDFQLGSTTSDEYLPGFRSACPQARILIHTGNPDLAHAAGIIDRGADVVMEKGRATIQDVVDAALHDP